MADDQSKLIWTPEQEVALFHAMQGRKPVGINKHFNMALIQHSFSQAVGFSVSTKDLWSYLYTLYDIDALDEVEKFPFPNEKKEFSLPDDIKQLKCIKGGTSETKESNTERGQSPEVVSAVITSSTAPVNSHRKRGRSSTGSMSPVSSPSNTKSSHKRKR